MAVAAVLAAGWVNAAEPAKPAVPPAPVTAPAADETELLGENTLWSHFRVTGPNHVRNEDGSLTRVKIKTEEVGALLQRGYWSLTSDWNVADAMPAPAADWAGPAFDDSAWPRERLPQPSTPLFNIGITEISSIFGYTGNFNQFDTTKLLTRATFTVKDPAQMKACQLSLDYWGGVVVYVNGKEAVRANTADARKDQAEIVAKDYPVEAFLMPAGKPLQYADEKSRERLALRDRQLREFTIPAALLRPGVNVLALECHAAPLPSQAVKVKGPGAEWPPIGILSARLTAAPSGAATGPRPAGIHVWNVMPYDTVTAFDYGDPARPLRPIVIRAARNSVFSGRLMVSSDQPIRGLKVTVTDLVWHSQSSSSSVKRSSLPTGRIEDENDASNHPSAARIPSAAVRVRYAVPATEAKCYVPTFRFDGLLDAIPAEIPVVEASLPKSEFYSLKTERRKLPAAAMAPLWFTVKVPRDLPAGEYEGQVRVAAEGLAETKVPLRVKVCAWTTPDPKDFRIQNGIYEAEEVVAKHYGVTNYSDKHFELVGKSLALLAEVNSRQVHAHLTINFCGRDNPETIVRWVKQPDGTFTHDFTAFEKYLEMIVKSIQTPNTLRLNCWPGDGNNVPIGYSDNLFERDGWGGTTVSVLDPATGKLETMPQPKPGTPESYTFWKPVFDGVLARVKKHGWLSQMTIGFNRDYGPPAIAVVENAHKLWPEGEWTWIAHFTCENAKFKGIYEGAIDDDAWYRAAELPAGVDPSKVVQMPVRHAFSVKSQPSGKIPPLWTLDAPRRNIFGSTVRVAIDRRSALREWRRLVEINTLQRGFDGIGEFGADVFPVKGKTGRWVIPPVAGGANWQANWGNPYCTHALLYPGPDGAVATERFENFREGLELAEAVIFVRHALHKGLLSGELKARAEAYLAPVTGERDRSLSKGLFMPRYMQDLEDAKLLDLAGEVAVNSEK
ncbi:MAG: hypothetical protein FJ225_02535 [Lentisphaerae bacterium]|nr:hypothetical protein [Lentisphaerota bacterium]